MNISHQLVGAEIIVFSVIGRINMKNASEFKDQIKRSLTDKSSKIYIDLSQVDYIDTSGLSALISILKETRKYEFELVIYRPSHFIRGLFQLTKMDRIFLIEDDGLPEL